jgi:hypothetical protein
MWLRDAKAIKNLFVTNAEQNKPKRLSLASFSRLVYCLRVGTEPTQVEYLQCLLLFLTRKYLTSPEENSRCTNPPAYLALPWVTKEKNVLTLTQSHVKLILARRTKKLNYPGNFLSEKKILFLEVKIFFEINIFHSYES